MAENTAALISHAQQFVGNRPNALNSDGRLSVNGMRTNAVLRKDEWERLDETLVGISRQRLIGIDDLRTRGLVEPLGTLGVLLSQYEQLGDMTDADVDWAAVTEGEKDSVSFTLVNVPVPITHKEFTINLRRLEASRNIGAPVDVTQVATASDKVVERLEETLFNGYTGGALDGNSLYGYTTSPQRNTSAGGNWATTATDVTTDTITAISGEEAESYFGPYVMYVATNRFSGLREFFTDGSGDQIFDRLSRIQGLEAVKPGDRLADGTAVLVDMRRSVVDVAIGQDLTIVEWETRGGMMMHFKVMAAIAPRVKSDAAGNSGVYHLTGLDS